MDRTPFPSSTWTDPPRAVVWLGTAAALLLLWQAAHIFLLTFVGVLLALFLQILVGPVVRHTPLRGGYALTAVVAMLVAVIGLVGWLVAPALAHQIALLLDALPDAVRELVRRFGATPLGRQVLDQVPSLSDTTVLSDALGRAASAFTATLGLIAYGLFVLSVGIFLAADPGRYRRAVVRLFPPRRRARAGELVTAAVATLRAWILGRALAMLIVGLVAGVGLWLLGVPLALGLGFLAGLLEFVPYVGPVLAAAPALLLAFVETPELALYVLLLYVGVQQLEGYVITPLIQAVAVHLPPVLTLVSTFVMGALFGALGLLVATPLAAVGLVLVRALYVEDVLEREDTEPSDAGQKDAKPAPSTTPVAPDEEAEAS